MEIQKILEYQKKDFEIIKIERMLNDSENKKITAQMVDRVKETQNKSLQLEKKAQELNLEFQGLQSSYEDNAQKFDKISKNDFSKLKEDEIASLESLTQSILTNLAVLDKKFIALAESIKRTLVDFENAKKNYALAREKHKKHKELFESETKKWQPQLEKLTSELAVLEKDIEPEILAKYKQRRQDRMFPIFVPLNSQSCGGCQMELSFAFTNRLKEKGFGECENCRRIIYIK